MLQFLAQSDKLLAQTETSLWQNW